MLCRTGEADRIGGVQIDRNRPETCFLRSFFRRSTSLGQNRDFVAGLS
ncbi:hypothetical protein PSDVSF_07140 [Pseudodesulfovibrio sediminis]|uniref:Uncharacterized protein n=1 Tax=Pseudodesulfovibrio sediminis TaxID=2810563 RepID=A0ABM7P3Z1_9BACT|nr:hypothetical protein PSDVSF_07140 [Pseudodesulfovibrio sediminis]